MTKNSCKKSKNVLEILVSKPFIKHIIKHINDILFSLLEAEDDYVESPILLQKIANHRANIEFNL